MGGLPSRTENSAKRALKCVFVLEFGEELHDHRQQFGILLQQVSEAPATVECMSIAGTSRWQPPCEPFAEALVIVGFVDG